jgi:hypothetical protein
LNLRPNRFVRGAARTARGVCCLILGTAKALPMVQRIVELAGPWGG